MNEEILTQLKTLVERAVRPVVAQINHKRKMREELLAHVTAVFEDEYERQGDEQAALDATRRRLGDPQALSVELQRGIPPRHRAAVVAFAALEFNSHKSLLRMAAIHFGLGLGTYMVAFLLFGLPVAFFRGRLHEIGTIMRLVLVMSVTMGSMTFGACLAADRMGPAVAARAWRRALSYLLLSTLFLPLWSFATYWALTGDLPASLAHLRFACLFTPVAPTILIIAARELADHIHHREEWASLDLDS